MVNPISPDAHNWMAAHDAARLDAGAVGDTHGVYVDVPARLPITSSDLTKLSDRRLRTLYGACVSLVEALTEIGMLPENAPETVVRHLVVGLEARCRDEIRARQEALRSTNQPSLF